MALSTYVGVPAILATDKGKASPGTTMTRTNLRCRPWFLFVVVFKDLLLFLIVCVWVPVDARH